MLVLMLIVGQVAGRKAVTKLVPAGIGFAAPIFAFGYPGMDSVTIAVDSFGPVSGNAQSVYELSHIESVPNVEKEDENNRLPDGRRGEMLV